MEPSFEETTKLNNFKAHRSVLLGEISVLSEQVNELIGQRNRLEVENEDLRREGGELASVASEVRRELQEHGSHLQAKEASLAVREQQVQDILNNAYDDADDIIARAKKDRDSIVNDANNLHNVIANLKREKEDIERDVEVARAALKTEKDQAELARKHWTTEVEKARDELLTLQVESINLAVYIETEKAKYSSTLKQNEKKERDIRDAAKRIHGRELAVADKEKDINIITSRLRKINKQLRPGKELNI